MLRPGEAADFKFARDIVRRLPKGYRIAWARRDANDERRVRARPVGKHPYLFGPDGEVVRGEGGQPVQIPTTPGSVFTVKATLARIRACGIDVR